jgi:hypothetical protein
MSERVFVWCDGVALPGRQEMQEPMKIRINILETLYGPMTLIRASALMAAVAMLLFAQHDAEARRFFEKETTSSFPSIIAYLETVSKVTPCPERPSFEIGCFFFHGFVARQKGLQTDVSFRWRKGKGGPVVVEPVVTITDGQPEFAPDIDPARIKVSLYSALRKDPDFKSLQVSQPVTSQ